MQGLVQTRLINAFGIFMLINLQAAYIQAYIRNEEKRTVTADQGENVILPCNLDFPGNEPAAYVVQWKKHGKSIPIYIWYQGYPPHFGEGYHNRISLAGDASLNLTKVTEKDQGWYECKIVYLITKSYENGTWIHLEVRAPPHFEVRPPEIEYVKLGEGVFIKCKAAGTPAPAVEWYKDKYKLRSYGRIEITRRGLRISNIQESDVGNYVCAATNREGRAEARFVILTAGGAVITVPPQNITVIEPNKVEFICDAKAIPSNITHRWYKDGIEVTELHYQIGRFKIREHDGGLVIHPSHADDSGKYTCEVTNGIGAPKTAHAFLNVEYPARVTHHPKQQFLPAGLPGKLKCHFKANPPVKVVTWKKDGVTVNFSEIILQKKEMGTLYFRKVLKEHAGRYTCTPCNIRGCAGDSEIMQVYVRDPPRFVLKPEPTYQRVINGEVKFVCEANGIPRPKVIWRRVDGLPIPRIRTVRRGGNLTLKGLKKEDHGIYECVIKNEVATIPTSTLLIVEDTSPHAPTNVTVIPGTFNAKVVWEPAYDGGHQQNYVLWYCEDGTNSWKQVKIPQPKTEVDVSPLKQYTKYFFKVKSRNKRGESKFSQTVGAITKSPGDHEAILPTEMIVAYNTTTRSVGHYPGPRNLTAKMNEEGDIIFTWLPPENPTVPVLHYIFEFRRKPSGGWLALKKNIPTSNTTYVLSGIKVRRSLYFRVSAHYRGEKEVPSASLKFKIPAQKVTGKKQEVTAGVIGGFLFLIVAIVLSVCGIKICNKRRRRKAEKAYMMVTCPVIESRNGGQSQAPSPVPLKKRRKAESSLSIERDERELLSFHELLKLLSSHPPHQHASSLAS